MTSRDQLTLFVPAAVSGSLEHVRTTLDPVQASLIAAHVTLCREDELDAAVLSLLGARLRACEARAVTLTFGAPQAFGGHGVLLPCENGEAEFHALRCHILGSANARRHAPHITLAHPRNPRSPLRSAADLGSVPSGLAITFNAVQHIRQQGAEPWRVLADYELR